DEGYVYFLDCVFFFQAEDGIRDFHVTGVQTCALPIFDQPEDHRDDEDDADPLQGVVTADEAEPGHDQRHHPQREARHRGPEQECAHDVILSRHRAARLGWHVARITGRIGTVTSSEHRRYVIVGSGAIGGTVGGLLARSGADVVLVARGAHAQALADRGLTLRTPDGTFEIGVTAAADPAEVRLTSRDV